MQKSPGEISRILDTLRGIHIKHDTGKALQSVLSRLFKVGEDGKLTHEPVLFTGGTETHSVVVIDGPGSGKTTAMLHAVRTSEALAENPETGMPRYIQVKVASPATLRSLARQFLTELGVDEVSDRVKVHELWAMVRQLLWRRGITLVMVDEAHDMFKATVASEADSMFRMLKSLMQGDHPVVLLLGGTQRLEQITRMDGQVNRRFRKIQPQPLDVAADGPKLRKLIAVYAENAGLSLGLRDDLTARLIHGARYRFGRCIEIIIAAVEEALLAGDDTLTGGHFEMAWGMQEGCPLTANVFAVTDFMAIELEDDDEIGDRLQEAREKKQRAKEPPKSKRGKKAA